jgi:CO/xanthine dehydrogenase Mo-binding subunit
MKQRASVGASVPRVDGRDKVRGAARYVDDLSFPGMLHGATVRSPVARGRLRAIERDPAFDWSDITVVTAADIPGENCVLLIERDQPALVAAGGEIRHVAEPVALVAAPTRRRAAEAAAHIRLDIEPLPPLLDLDDALAANIRLHGEDNVFSKFLIAKGDIDAGLAEADLVIEGVYHTGAQEQMYIEPQGMIARWEDGRCYVVGSLQCPFYVHKALMPLLGLGPDEVIVRQSVTGGGFGGKEEYPSIIAGHAALLSARAGRPVKLVYDRDEDIAATTKRHPSRVRHRLGLRADGTICAIDVDVVLDGGAYLTLTPVVLSRAVLHAAGPYRCPNVRIVGRAVATNHPPHGAFRGFGAPQTTFAYERQSARAAAALGIDPLEFRRKNMLRPGDTTATSQLLEQSVGSVAVLEAVAAAAGERPLGLRREGGAGDPPIRRGRGIAFYFHGAGFTGSGEQRLAGRATVAALRGGGFEVRASSTDIGQGSLTMFTQIAATALDVPIDAVRVADPDTSQVPDSGPTVASRTCMVVGGVVERAARALRESIETWAAQNDMAGAPLTDAAARMTAGGEIAETVQYSPPPGIEWDDASYTGAAYPVFGWACCLVDVAVDLDTFEVTIERCVHAIDVGKAIHPIIVKGQIEGGTLQALGWALLESVVYLDGRVVNDRMTNSIVPTFADAPEMETILIEEPYAHGPHGAKGVGEIPMDGPAAAVANAIVDALGDAPGVDIDEVPMLPEVIAAALRREAVA